MNRTDERGPVPIFGIFGAIGVVVGIVVGIGIFRLPSIVARHSASEFQYLMFWFAGGFISISGALCYAELASNHPDAGGEYYFLSSAFGDPVGFLFTWGRMTVIQTGAISLAAFILGDYASEIIQLGTHSSSIYAGLTIVFLTAINVMGTSPSKTVQGVVTGSIVVILLLISFLGIFVSTPSQAVSGPMETSAAGAAFIFILLTYGGWNEGVYLSAELEYVEQNMVRVLVIALLVVTLIYGLINTAYLQVLGLESLRTSETIGVEMMERLVGAGSSELMALFVVIAALSTINASILTGARTNYALGRDFELVSFLGEWDDKRNTPRNALLFQGAICLGLVGLGSISKEAVSTMVDYTAPVFWFFILLTTASLFVFRRREEKIREYQVPFYPWTPLFFIGACGYLFYSSLVFTGVGAFLGVVVLILGVPLYYFA